MAKVFSPFTLFIKQKIRTPFVNWKWEFFFAAFKRFGLKISQKKNFCFICFFCKQWNPINQLCLERSPFASSGENFATMFDSVFSNFKSFSFSKFSNVGTPLAIVEISFSEGLVASISEINFLMWISNWVLKWNRRERPFTSSTI